MGVDTVWSRRPQCETTPEQGGTIDEALLSCALRSGHRETDLFACYSRRRRERAVGRRTGARRKRRPYGTVEVVAETREGVRVVGVDKSLRGSRHCKCVVCEI